MIKKRLGKSDLEVSVIGLGCMSLGQDESHARRIIDEALELGVNFFDTADLYDRGRNEEIVGKALRGRRSQVVLATKVGNRIIPGQDGWVWDASKEYILEAVKQSLRRLGTDYIDLYQLHGGTIDDPIDETIEAFETLREQGWIRWYGISSIRPNVIREYVKRSNIVSVMNQYSIVDRRAEEEVIPLLSSHGIGIIARGPVAQGILTDNGGHKTEKGFLDYTAEELRALRERLKQLSQGKRSLTHTALRYCLDEPAVHVTLVGASTVEQLRENVAAVSAPALTEEERAAIRAISKANRYTLHR
jgi:aryl-alcohol dehydrogenase-like predicted oxidoreductase